MAYRADIEIAVKGAQELKRLQDQVSATSKLVDGLNNYLENIGSGGVVRNIQNLRNVVGEAAAAFNQAALGTKEATLAARNYIAATDSLNAGLAERLALLKNITEETRIQNLAANNATTITRVANAGPLGVKGQLSTRLQEFLANKQSAQIARENSAAALQAERGTSKTFEMFPGGQYSTVKQRTVLNEIASIQNSVAEAVARTGRSQRQLEIASVATAKSNAQRVQISTVQNKIDEQSVAIARARNQELAKELGIEVNIGKAAGNTNKKRGGAAGPGRGKLAKDALSNAAVGGAFPLLFGQSGSAAAGGAIGGALGSAIPGIGGFGGSLIGTILGEKLGQANQVKQLGEDIGFSAEQTKLLGIAFQQAGRDFDKFQQSVSTIQGLSLSIEDQAKAIQLASSLTETYKGKIDKVTNAFAGALSTGKVTQGTLNQLTNNGIPIQQALADKYNVSRSAIIQMAKDGKISVQDLIDTLVKVGNEGAKAAGKQKDVFADSFEQISQAVADFQTTASQAFKETADALRVDLGEAVQAVTNYITDLIGGFAELARVAGPVLDPIISGYIKLEKAIFNAVGAVPALRDAIVQFVFQVAGPLAGVVTLMNQIRNAGKAAKGPERQGPYVPDRLKQKPLESFIVPSQAAAGGGGSNKAANDAKRLAEQTKKQLDDAFKLNELASARLELQVSLSGEETLEAEFNKIALERRIKFVDLQKAALSDKERELLASAQLSNILSDNNQYEKDKQKLFAQQTAELYTQIGLSDVLGKKFQGNLAGGFMGTSGTGTFRTDLNLVPGLTGGKLGEEYANIEQQLKDLLDPANQVITAANAIGTAFGESFKGLISGTLTAREALAGFFESIASSFADMAAQILTEYIKLQIIGVISKFFPGPGPIGGTDFSGAFGGGGGLGSSQFVAGNSFGGFLASGGPAMAGTPYIVGEKGPELFMPGRSGTVIPNNALGGSTSVVVNVDASGNSNVQGDQQQGKQLGVAISAAVQAELVKQQRPGGLLAGTRR